MSFDQPWAEYMRQRESDFPPLHFADALVRAGLGLGGLMMEINVGYSPGGTLLAAPLGVQPPVGRLEHARAAAVAVALRCPAPITRTRWPSSRWSCRRAVGRGGPAGVGRPASCRYALAKPTVQGVVWNQLRDSQPHDFPHGGLFDDRRQAKPALRTLAAIRQTYLK